MWTVWYVFAHLDGQRSGKWNCVLLEDCIASDKQGTILPFLFGELVLWEGGHHHRFVTQIMLMMTC